MIRNAITLLIALSLAHMAVFSTALAEGSKESTVRLLAGLNSSTYVGDGLAPQKQKLGFSGGLSMTMPVNEVFAIQVHWLFSMKGSKWTYPYEEEPIPPTDTTETTIRLNYFEFPILFRLSLSKEGTVRPAIFAGPTIAYQLSSTAKVESAGVTVTRDIKGSEGFEKWDNGMAFGAGLEFGPRTGGFSLDFLYILGLANTARFGEIKNREALVLIGYSF